MRGKSNAWIGAVVGSAALLLSLVACASLPAKPVGYLAIGPSDGISVPHEATRLGPEKALLLGPNFGLTLDWVYVAEEIEGSAAKYLGLGEGARAADGHELLFAGLGNDDRFTRGRWAAPGDDSKAALAAEIHIGRRTRKLDAVPKPDSLLVASVPKGAPARLTVLDEGVVMSIDLRTGRSEGGLGNVPRTTSDADYAEEGRVATLSGTKTLDMEIKIDGATLEAYHPGPGWASSDRRWLLLRLSRVSSGGLTQTDLGDPVVGFLLDPAKTFELRAQGRRMRPESGPVLNTVKPGAQYVALIDVPASFRTGELRITPDGPLFTYRGPSSLAAYWNVSRRPDCGSGGRVRCLDWSRRPPARTVRLTLS